ncbi:hypothetical protein EJM73_08505 [Clostridium botulinum]|uniref:hypothetical protein n=1 Tax=Clostridium botulinum TaxID=1491 RepID=UPI0013759975|nr:hypothetical protein [Clostridium botulinum]NCI19940.1 hypothetical protein [Clostridium botulinum]NCI35702.1 hypothetical protein [Clostridium botulinum]NCI71559.1 hypothetical protein [Clostridium botulinum]NDI38751.1 hypothetical protein [Clostridium botulinum]
MIIQLLILFVLKMLDCAISTLKSLLLIKRKDFLSSLCSALSQFFYLTLLVKITKDNSNLGIFVICLGALIGSYLPKFIIRHTDKDKTWIYEIIPQSTQQSQEIADMLRNNKLEIFTIKGYNFDVDKILTIKAFSNNKEESNLIENLIPKDVSFHVMEVKKQLNLE